MNVMHRSRVWLVAVGSLGAVQLLVGCAAPAPGGSSAPGAGSSGTVASEATAASVRRIGFLTDYARLRPVPDGGGILCWRSTGVDWKQYNKVMFERIQVSLKSGSMHPVDPTDLKVLVDTEIGLKYAADINAGAAGAAENWVNGYMDSFAQWSYAKTAFDKWAADFARRFAALRSS